MRSWLGFIVNYNKNMYCLIEKAQHTDSRALSMGSDAFSEDGEFLIADKGDSNMHPWVIYTPDKYPQYIKDVFLQHGITSA